MKIGRHFRYRCRAVEGHSVFRRFGTVQDLANFECQVGRAGRKPLCIFRGIRAIVLRFTDCTVLRGHGVWALG